MKKTSKTGPKEVTDEHKQAMAVGRREARIVGDYLAALRDARPKRGRRRTEETVQRQMQDVDTQLRDNPEPLRELKLIQERQDLAQELEQLRNSVTLDEYEQPFIDIAVNYSGRQGISYSAWREVGVPADVLRRAGIKR